MTNTKYTTRATKTASIRNEKARLSGLHALEASMKGATNAQKLEAALAYYEARKAAR